jgi:hypothetical protein
MTLSSVLVVLTNEVYRLAKETDLGLLLMFMSWGSGQRYSEIV